MAAQAFVALWDIHHGSDTRRGKKEQAHDAALLQAVGQFVGDFKPDLLVMGGDNLHCGPVSHWLKDKKRAQEGSRWTEEVEEFDKQFFTPLDKALTLTAKRVWLDGNHEDWVEDLLDKNPQLDDKQGSLLHHKQLLKLRERKWTYLPQGSIYQAGHLHFIHGDTIKGGANVAKQAVERYGANIRFGHHHTFQTHTLVHAANIKERKTGIAVPCLGRLNPAYMQDAPNRWIQGFLAGFIHRDGSFNDYVVVATGGRFSFNGKTYKG
jgi:hypothetical protein